MRYNDAMRHREPAICLRTVDYSETSQVVHFLTRGQGVVRLLAKGSKRTKSKSGGALDLFSRGDLVFTDSRSGGLGTLIEFSETSAHPGLRQDVRRLHAGLYMLELTAAMLAEGDPHPEIHDLLVNALTRLAQPDAPAPAVLAYFQWRLLKRVGLLGDLTHCSACGGQIGERDSGVYFSSGDGGLLCADCEPGVAEKHALDAATLAGLRTVAAAEAGRRAALPDEQADGVNRLLSYHVTQLRGRPLRMARYAVDVK